MEPGLAVPHATVPGLMELVIGVALAPEPVQFGAGRDGTGARLLRPPLSPGGEREHVKVLARICRLGRHENFIDRLEETENDQDIVCVIETIDAMHM